MRLLKSNPLLRMLNSYLVDNPEPSNLSYNWNYGSLLGTCLMLQILTGIFLAMHYTPHIDLAFQSTEHIMRDVSAGWAVRYAHANIASFFFIFVYAQFYKYYNKIFSDVTNLYKSVLSLTLKIILFLKINLINLETDIDRIFQRIESIENINKLPKSYSSYDDFLQWFVGFSDAESAFMINIKNSIEAHFIFQITLHIDDIDVLKFIKHQLGIGIISIKGNYCSFRVHSFQDIITILLPIFDKYCLLTYKQLNYRDWRKAIILKHLSIEKGFRSLDNKTLLEIIKLKNGMNKSRISYDGYRVSLDMINKNWLLGFVEGDGTFYLSNNTVVFGITQKSKEVLLLISQFIQNLPIITPYKGLFIPNKPNCIIKNNKNAYQLVITDKDVLFQYIFPFFNNLTFHSRKGIDFSIWSIGLYLYIFGYVNLPEGKTIIRKLFNIMNNKRYFTSLSELLTYKDIIEIKNILSKKPPFDIFTGKSHFILSKEYSLKKGSRKGFKLYIYKNGIEIENSPFDSFRSGGRAIGLNSVSSITNYIDTGRVFKDEYTFYSEPVLNVKDKK